MTTIYFVRHGESVANKEKRFTGRFNAPLSDLGKEQAQMVASFLKNIKFDVVFSSPLDRAYKTAQIIFPDNDILTSDKLLELDGGVWNGDYYSNISEKYSDLLFTFKNKLDDFVAINGESTSQLQKRAVEFIGELIENYSGKTICVVTHAVVIRVLFAHYLNKKVQDLSYVTNCSVSTLEFDDKNLTSINYNMDGFLKGKGTKIIIDGN